MKILFSCFQNPAVGLVTDQAFREAGFEPKILFETSSAASVPSFVAAGICCAIIPRYYARDQKGIALFISNPVLAGRWISAIPGGLI